MFEDMYVCISRQRDAVLLKELWICYQLHSLLISEYSFLPSSGIRHLLHEDPLTFPLHVPSSAFSLSSWLLVSGGKMEAFFFYCWVPVIDGSWDQICLVEHLKTEKSNLANNHLRILHRAKVLTDGFRKGHLHKIYTQNINTLELGVFCRALLGKCATSLCPLWVGQPSHRLCRDSR